MSRLPRARSVAVALASLALVAAGGTAAQAKPFSMGKFSGTDSFTDVVCGLEVQFDVEFSGHDIVRPVHGSDQAFLGHTSYDFREVITNPETGAFVTTHGHGVFHERHATQVEGDIYFFEAHDAGSFTVFDSDGNRIARANGVVRLTALFDTLGDFQPGGEFIEETEEFRGQVLDDEAFCAAVLPELT